VSTVDMLDGIQGVLHTRASNLRTPSKRVVSATVIQSSKRTVADRHITSTSTDELPGGTNIDDLERPSTPK